MAKDVAALSVEKTTLLAIRALRQRVEELEAASREPIAIVGMACCFPGGVNTPDDYWNLLEQKRDAVSEIPCQRMPLNAIFDPNPQTPGKTYSRSAGMLDSPGDFDAEFFGISPREAVSMDPQHRLLLEASWEALESAGINPKGLAGQNAGVFIGITTSEYSQLLQRIAPREELGAYVLQGSALNAAAGRLSYFYGLNGPSLAIDTACSSSLVAIDRACRSLREGETEMAIAAGVNILASPEPLIIASQWGMLSPSGRVRAFSFGADGFVRGEGCGVLLLKRLSDARACGDRIFGLLLGSAVNQDGASSGLTVPNGLAQQSLLREAHRRAGIEARQVGYVEAHGTGTALGDPIEAEALGAVFADRGEGGSKLQIGSVKTNVGHLESAAGVAGLIKVVLGLQHGVIPGQLHWSGPSEHVRWSDLPLEVVNESRRWDAIGGRRIGGVSSFGFSGTNAHVVVEGWEEDRAWEPESKPREEVLVVTGRTEAALRDLVERYAAFLEWSESGWSEICWTAAIGRAVFAERLAVVGWSKAEAAEKLREWQRESSASGVHRGHVSVGRRAGGASLGAGASAAEVAAGFVQGKSIAWAERQGEAKPRRVSLPTYAFQRERYWIESPVEAEKETSGEPTGRGLLGSRLRLAGVVGQYETQLRESSWIGEHRVGGGAVLPATGHVELMLEAGAEVLGADCVLEDVVFETPLSIAGERRAQTVVEQATGDRSRVRVYAEQGSREWERVSEGWLRRGAAQLPERVQVEEIQGRLQPVADLDSFYAELSGRGVEFGERFRGLQRAWTGGGEALGEIALQPMETEGWELAPWWLDACLQVAGLAADREAEPDGTGQRELYLPQSVERLEVYGQPGERSWSHVTLRRLDADSLSANLTVTDSLGAPLLRFSNLRFRKFVAKKTKPAIYGIDWIEAPDVTTPVSLKGHWVIVSGDDFGEEVCRQLQTQGASYSLISTPNVIDVNKCREALRNIVSIHGEIEGVVDLRSAGAVDLVLQEPESDEPQNPVVVEGCLSLLQALLLEQIHPPSGLKLITRQGRETADLSLSAGGYALQALRRTAVLEFPELSTQHLDLHRHTGASDLLRLIAFATEPEAMVRREKLFVPRLRERTATSAEGQNVELVSAASGLIEDLETISTERQAPGDTEVEIAVHAHGINFRDVMNSLGMLPGMIQRLGGECAGVVVNAGSSSGFKPGARVFAFAPASFKRFVTVPSANVTAVPQNLSFAQAAALPVVYLTALYGLDRLANLQRGNKVLIHSAAGGLGLAAVNVARARGAEIFATAGNEKKRAYLRSLGIQHVMPSRTEEFADEVMRLTDGRGVGVVLNSLTGALAEKTLSILSKGGYFLEVGKRNTLGVDAVKHIRPDVRHIIYDLGQAAAADPSLVPALFRELLESIATGRMSPLPVTEFDDPKEAFRYMAQARHIGKVVVSRTDAANTIGLLTLNNNATYVITGGYGALGLIFAERLVDRGARHLILIGRNKPDAIGQEAIERMRFSGAEVKLVTVDVSDRGAMESVFEEIPASEPLKGVFHSAGVLDDHSLLEQSPASLSKVMRPKWRGAWNLHRITSHHDLDFFVLFSSAAATLGSPGQTNYAIANATLDALAIYRRSLGLPALSIQWGPWHSAGMTEKLKTNPSDIGLGRIEPDDGFAVLESLLTSNETVATALSVLSWKKLVNTRPAGTSAFFSMLAETDIHVPKEDAQAGNQDFCHALLGAAAEDRRVMLMEHLRQQTAQILSLPSQVKIDQDEALHDLGLDSLMAVELRNALMTSLGRQLSPTMVLDYPTLRTLTDFLLGEISEGRKPSNAADRGSEDINALSDSEAESLLLAELGRRGYGPG
jgi:acyl transferase domain-containing protein/NADPH:quinone reductase-like Zn-dependent oxidoreductase/acyl carrier protein